MPESPATLVRMAVAFVFGYESAALVSRGRVPTVTYLCARHRWLAAASVAGLALHFVLCMREWDERWEIVLPSDYEEAAPLHTLSSP